MNQNQKVKHQQKSPANPRCLDKNLAGSIEFWGARPYNHSPARAHEGPNVAMAERQSPQH